MKRIKIPRLFNPKKMLAATAARRGSAASAGMDFEEMPEPNMKLSRALLIVLLLHVVAVLGIIAFNAIKNRGRSFISASSAKTEAKPSPPGGLRKKTKGAKAQTATWQKKRRAPRGSETFTLPFEIIFKGRPREFALHTEGCCGQA